jgi:type I site-specific restriction endonuclease
MLLYLQHDLHDLWEVTSNAQSDIVGYRQVGKLFYDFLVVQEAIRSLNSKSKERGFVDLDVSR